MIFSVISAVVLGVTGVYMLLSGKYAITRRMALIPLAMAAMETAMCGALDWGMFPALTAVLVLCRLTVLFCCHRVLKKDMAMERNRRRRREVWRRIAATAPQACVIAPATAGKVVAMPTRRAG